MGERAIEGGEAGGAPVSEGECCATGAVRGLLLNKLHPRRRVHLAKESRAQASHIHGG